MFNSSKPRFLENARPFYDKCKATFVFCLGHYLMAIYWNARCPETFYSRSTITTYDTPENNPA
jgi:hypothetical protein